MSANTPVVVVTEPGAASDLGKKPLTLDDIPQHW